MNRVLKLGTRRSLLALAQSQWVANQIKRANPGLSVELVGIDTRGDQIQDIPLTQVEGKEFFVAELDQALSEKRVDLTVHSMKDLSLDRPSVFVCAAIPKRENPRDIILFSPEILDRIKAGKTIQIGTSSPRRIENIPSFLKKALPQIAPATEKNAKGPILQFVEIRGNVNTRLARVKDLQNSPRALDGVVLAFAGLIRLWADPKGREELQSLLAGLKWMVLPLAESPTAPAQGALAIECRKEDSFTHEAIQKIHDTKTESQVSRERQLLADCGGGCHQRFGATVIESPELGELLYLRGKLSTGKEVDELSWQQPKASETKGSAWDGSLERKKASQKETNPVPLSRLAQSFTHDRAALFVAHSRAISDSIPHENLKNSRIWVSGTHSWFNLAEKGLWVEGSAENLGFAPLLKTLTEGVLQLPPLTDWTVLTHSEATQGWIEQGIRALSTYKLNLNYGTESKSSLKAASHVFWSSGSQFDELKESLSRTAVSACGPGKTAAHLRKNGIEPLVFPTAEEWKQWLNHKTQEIQS